MWCTRIQKKIQLSHPYIGWLNWLCSARGWSNGLIFLAPFLKSKSMTTLFSKKKIFHSWHCLQVSLWNFCNWSNNWWPIRPCTQGAHSKWSAKNDRCEGFKHYQRHNGLEGWVLLNKVTYQGHITSFYTNLNQISSSESRPSINFKISTKHQHFD